MRRFFFPVALILVISSFALPVFAETTAPKTGSSVGTHEKLTLTVLPPLFQVNLAPGDTWRTTLRVVNGNDYSVDLHASVENFHPDGETGTAIFEAKPQGGVNPRSFAAWIEIPPGPFHVEPGATAEIPFTLHIPKDAEPGGHYAGILVGTEPLKSIKGGGVAIGSYLSSLIFARIAGNVVEKGDIRDFYPDRSFVEDQNEHFVLRFENSGNVHLVPRGAITIYNMWGKVRGTIAINETNTFGNVLPNTTRKFEFSWAGESNMLDLGRYRAEAVLNYGFDGKKTVFRTAYFWVIPWRALLIFVGVLLVVVRLIAWLVTRYVHKALLRERERLGLPDEDMRQMKSHTQPKNNKDEQSLFASVFVFFGELRKRDAKEGVSERVHGWKVYRPLLPLLLLLLVGIVLIGWYFVEVLKDERSYQMVVTKDGGRNVLVK